MFVQARSTQAGVLDREESSRWGAKRPGPLCVHRTGHGWSAMPGGLDMGKQHVLTALDMARGRGDYVVCTLYPTTLQRGNIRTSGNLFAQLLANHWTDFDKICTAGRHSHEGRRVCDLATFVKYSRVKWEIRENRKSLITQKVKLRS